MNIVIQQWSNKVIEEEAKAVYNAIMSRHISEGEYVRKFESKIANLLNMPYVLATPNGTSALALAFMGAGVKPGDEVIVPDVTFIATANAARMLGATVVVADTMVDKPLINHENVMKLITEKTKIVIPVDINGRRACTKILKSCLADKNILVIEDACQSFLSGGKENYIGNDADIACYSFAISKLFTTGQGGMVTTKDKNLYEKMKRIKFQGVDSVFECTNYMEIGFNFKLTDMLASIGILQLERMEEKILNVSRIYKMYKEGLHDIEGISFLSNEENEVISNVDILCDYRDNLRNIMEENDIQVRPNYKGLHTAKYLEARDCYINSKKFIDKILFLPSGPDQKVEDIEQVIEIIRKNKDKFFIRQKKRGRKDEYSI